MRVPRIYIAGPYSNAPEANVNRAMAAWHALADAGFVPFLPHLSHYLHLHRQRDYQEWLAHDLQWLALCNAVLRLPGDSPGADVECLYAVERAVPVFHSVEALVQAFGRRNGTSGAAAKKIDAPESLAASATRQA